MKKLLSNQICPNLRLSDALYLWAQLPRIWSKKQLDFSSEFGTQNYLLTNSGRTALGILMSELKLPKEKKIGIPAFCCAVMATPFITAGYKIQWLDTDEQGMIDPTQVEKFKKDLSLLLIPHIFGQRAPIKEILEIIQSEEIITVEDCAHSLPSSGRSTEADTNYKILSFGREKVISCVSGGALLWKDASPFALHSHQLQKPKTSWTLSHMLQPLIYSLSLPWWYQGGKIIPILTQKLKLLPKAVTASEKKGAEDFPQAKLPFPLQKLLKRQFNHVSKTCKHRTQIAADWSKILEKTYTASQIITPPNALRLILKLKTPEEKQKILSQFKSRGLLLNDWDGVPISPSGVKLPAFGYKKGLCPNAEDYAAAQITFPTSIRIKSKNLKKFNN